MKHSLGERLKILRLRKGFTQKQLADKSGLTQSTISNLEKETKDPSIFTLEKIAKALDINLLELFLIEGVYTFDLNFLKKNYNKADKLTPELYTALGRVVQYAKDIKFI